MYKLLIAAALFAAFPLTCGAQVQKQVEVTKAYVPSLDNASKLRIVPDMTDTVKMRPEIDYTVTPLSLRTTLTTRPIRPATVTYWEFNRPLPFYIKVGAGYPLNSVLDFYASTQNPGTGYVLGYVNHVGRYAKIANDFGVKNNSERMFNRVGAAAGKYFGKRILEGDISYENRMLHRYGAFYPEGWDSPMDSAPGAMIDFGDANAAFRFGDDFQDLSRVNFELSVRGGLFFDHSSRTDYTDKARQTTLGAGAKIARAFGRHSLSVDAGYTYLKGQKSIDGFREQIINAGLRYGVEGGVVSFEAGADYYCDRIDSTKTRNYILPFLRLDFNLGTAALKPFLEIDGQLRDNSYRSLSLLEPYLVNPTTLDRSTVSYNGRLGLGGSLWRDKFSYRLYAGFSIHDNQIYWVGLGGYDPASESFAAFTGEVTPVMARQTSVVFHGEMEYRPVNPLVVSLQIHGNVDHDEIPYQDGCAPFQGLFGVRYEGRKFTAGVSAGVTTSRTWTLLDRSRLGQFTGRAETDGPAREFKAPAACDLRVNFDWRVSGRVALFAEGRNLLNRRLYEYPWQRDYGANFTLGVKASF